MLFGTHMLCIEISQNRIKSPLICLGNCTKFHVFQANLQFAETHKANETLPFKQDQIKWSVLKQDSLW